MRIAVIEISPLAFLWSLDPVGALCLLKRCMNGIPSASPQHPRCGVPGILATHLTLRI